MASDVVCHLVANTDELVVAIDEMRHLKEAGAMLPEWLEGTWFSGSPDDVLEMIQGPTNRDANPYTCTITIRPTAKFRQSLEDMRRQVQ